MPRLRNTRLAPSHRPVSPIRLLGLIGLTATLIACSTATGSPPDTGPSGDGGGRRQQAARAGDDKGPRPYTEVVTPDAETDEGLFTVHRVDDKLLFEIPDSLFGRDMLLISRISGVQ